MKATNTIVSGDDMSYRHHITYRSHNISELLKMVDEMASLKRPVLIYGETGTGKELVARRLHETSSRQGKFVAENCATIPENLFESILFGHVRGSHDGAYRDKKGLLELASDGTIFLDEIGRLPLSQQAKLLRVLQENEIRRVGDDRSDPIPITCRFIFATKQNLEEMVDEGLFLEDLLYRIDILQITVPPLRERMEDIQCLTKLFIKNFAEEGGWDQLRISSDAMAALKSYMWPGNVRELDSAVCKALLLARRDGDTEIQKWHFQKICTSNELGKSVSPQTAIAKLTDIQREVWDSLVATKFMTTKADQYRGKSKGTTSHFLSKPINSALKALFDVYKVPGSKFNPV
ncbi:MAG: sigma-54-dependent Fis family transcriptional regulator [Magnetococcales bacterium]|nr:sigma-54-dependent Fis family transcriptional regulator [Magnetococcales bacterium]